MAKMLNADAIIIGSPVYFANMTAEVKALIDRLVLYHLIIGGLFENKIGCSYCCTKKRWWC